ncbi:MAG: IS5/IS1182 family transposase, partial [Chthonomonadaceae bacterium]|nr:IS5/IS1182 family transposase [Chthonomonadaceae bacterium]
MFYSTMQTRSAPDFKRLTGVSPETFALMREVLSLRLPQFGRPPKLPLQDRLLMVL